MWSSSAVSIRHTVPSTSRLMSRMSMSTSNREDTSDQLRHLMRNVPQPIAIACTRVTGEAKYHGATLSSFTSLTLHPHPLVAFSLRLPSRLADHLRPPAPTLSGSSSPITPGTGTSTSTPHPTTPAGLTTPDPLSTTSSPLSNSTSISPSPFLGKRLSISLLSLPHSPIATTLSKPGHDTTSLFTSSAFTSPPDPSADAPDLIPGTLSSDSVPVVDGCIGTLQCEVVSSTPLRDMIPTDPVDEEEISFDEETEGSGLKPLPANATMATNEIPQTQTPVKENERGGDEIHGSELFICRVLSVEHGSGPNASNPLLYWRHKYTTVSEPDY